MAERAQLVEVTWRWTHDAALAALVVGATLLTYRHAPQNAFHFDDVVNIEQEFRLQLVELTPANLWRAARAGDSRPIAAITFAIDWWRGGGAPRQFLQTNVLIHLINALLVLALLATILRRWFPEQQPHASRLAATAGALFWALHPLQTQAVAYVVQRMASLGAMFFLLACLAYLRWRTTRAPIGLAGLVLAAGLAFMSKENTWCLPAALVLLELGVLRAARPRLLAEGHALIAWAVIGVGAVAVVIDLASGAGPLAHWLLPGYEIRPFGLSERLLTQPRVIFFHLGQLLAPWPGRFSLEHDFVTSTGLLTPLSTAPALLGVFGWVALALLGMRQPRYRPVCTLLLWPPLTLLIESSAVPLEMVFEHRMYLPSVGMAGLLSLGLLWTHQRLPRATRLVAAMTAVVIVALALVTIGQIEVWRTPLRLWSRAVDLAPNSARAHSNLGITYHLAGENQPARAHLERALQLDPTYVSAARHLATVLGATNQTDTAAVPMLRRAAEAAPNNPRSWVLLGDALKNRGDYRSAVESYERALKLAPERADILNAAGIACWEHGNKDQARSYFEQALEIAPGYILALRNLGIVLGEGYGRREEGIALLRQAVDLQPTDGMSWLSFAQGLLEAGQSDGALEALNQGVEVAPGNAKLWAERGWYYLQRRQGERARADFDRALALPPLSADTLEGRAKALLMLGRHIDALADCDVGQRVDPSMGVFPRIRGYILRIQGKQEQARQQFRRGCELGDQPSCRAI